MRRAIFAAVSVILAAWRPSAAIPSVLTLVCASALPRKSWTAPEEGVDLKRQAIRWIRELAAWFGGDGGQDGPLVHRMLDPVSAEMMSNRRVTQLLLAHILSNESRARHHYILMLRQLRIDAHPVPMLN